MHSKGQSVVEISLLIACIIAALLAMKMYIVRAINGRLKEAMDTVGLQQDYIDRYSEQLMDIVDSKQISTVDDVSKVFWLRKSADWNFADLGWFGRRFGYFYKRNQINFTGDYSVNFGGTKNNEVVQLEPFN